MLLFLLADRLGLTRAFQLPTILSHAKGFLFFARLIPPHLAATAVGSEIHTSEQTSAQFRMPLARTGVNSDSSFSSNSCSGEPHEGALPPSQKCHSPQGLSPRAPSHFSLPHCKASDVICMLNIAEQSWRRTQSSLVTRLSQPEVPQPLDLLCYLAGTGAGTVALPPSAVTVANPER